jgi:hypothetical protein
VCVLIPGVASESLGAVLLAGFVAGVVGWLTRRFAPGFTETPLNTFAAGAVGFVAALWGIAVLLIPGRRPSSISGRWGATAWSVGAGLLIAGIAVGSTWAYLSSIEIDDCLEGLVFLPILGAASILVALAARSWLGQFRPVVRAVAACVGIAVAATAHAWSRSAGPSVRPLYTLTVLVFLFLTLVGVAGRHRCRRPSPQRTPGARPPAGPFLTPPACDYRAPGWRTGRSAGIPSFDLARRKATATSYRVRNPDRNRPCRFCRCSIR